MVGETPNRNAHFDVPTSATTSREDLTEEERAGLIAWLRSQIAYDEDTARDSAQRGRDAKQESIQTAARRNTLRSFEWWLRHGSDALAAVTLGDLATLYASRSGYRDHCPALTRLASFTVDNSGADARVAASCRPQVTTPHEDASPPGCRAPE